jgi:hypothetical protein
VDAWEVECNETMVSLLIQKPQKCGLASGLRSDGCFLACFQNLSTIRNDVIIMIKATDFQRWRTLHSFIDSRWSLLGVR